jgi:peptide deformylase
MAILDILQYPNPRLRLKGKKVEDFGADFQKIIDDMFETHYNAKNCAALAATQLNIPHAPYVTVIDFSEQKNQPLCLVNAVIVERHGETNEPEGCMSVEHGYEKVKRSETITIEFQDRHGNPKSMKADGFMAKCIQHELDHLEGILFVDRIAKLKKDRIAKQIEQSRRRQNHEL